MIKLQKAETISLVKDHKLTTAAFGLGWKPGVLTVKVDLDASCLALDAESKGVDFIFYNHKTSFGGAISLDGDDLTGADNGEGADAPDETITIKLDQVPANVTQLLLIVNSYSGQTFGAVQDVFCRVTNTLTQTDLVEYDLDAEYSKDKAIVVAKLSREAEDWKFTAVGKGFPGGAQAILNLYGMAAS